MLNQMINVHGYEVTWYGLVLVFGFWTLAYVMGRDIVIKHFRKKQLEKD